MALPWFREKSRRGELAIDDCKRCKKTTGREQRIALGCGYEPPADDRVHLTVWQPPSGDKGYSGPDLTVCAGYTCNLPEVNEIAIARLHWSKGNMPVHATAEELLDAIVILDNAYNQLQVWLMTPAKDGGGGS